MATDHNSEPMHIENSLTNSEQKQPLSIDANNNNNIEVPSSQATSLASSGSSIGSTSSNVRTEDGLFDKIEDMISDYMCESKRHYLHCRVLRWTLEDDPSCQFSAVIVINPPIRKN
jgi:hypothetical protein